MLNAVSHLVAKQSTRVVVAQPDERHAHRTSSVLEWYDGQSNTEHTASGSNEEVNIKKYLLYGELKSYCKTMILNLTQLCFEALFCNLVQ